MKLAAVNLLVLIGCGGIVYGAWTITPALAYILGGFIALVLAVNLSRGGKPR